MERSSKKKALIVIALSVVGALLLSTVIRVLLSPSAGGISSSMFYCDGTVTDISIETCHVDILVCRSGIYDPESTVTFDLSGAAEELDDLSLGEMVTVHHWVDSMDGETVVARSIEPIKPETDDDASCGKTR